jgi:hypothetical protein
LLAMTKFLVGAVLTYVGFFLFLAGFIMSTTSIPILVDMIRAVIPLDMTTALVATIFQVLSGVVGVTGLLLCIASVSKPTPAPITIVQQVPVTAPPAPVPAQSPARATPPSLPVQSGACKFCGHYIEPNETYCPSCNRAQR